MVLFRFHCRTDSLASSIQLLLWERLWTVFRFVTVQTCVKGNSDTGVSAMWCPRQTVKLCVEKYTILKECSKSKYIY